MCGQPGDTHALGQSREAGSAYLPGIPEQVQGVTSNSKDFSIPEFEVQLFHFLMIDLDIHVNL